jgi:hypothetical protein
MVTQKTQSDTLVRNGALDNAFLLGLGTGLSSHSMSQSSPYHREAVERKYHVTIGKRTTNNKMN